jgi:micrococcal nuclease
MHSCVGSISGIGWASQEFTIRSCVTVTYGVRRSGARFPPFRCPVPGCRTKVIAWRGVALTAALAIALAIALGLAMAASILAPALAQGRRPAPERCHLESVGGVGAVIDGRSFLLDDGREIRLPGIEVPLLPRAGETGVPADAGRGARAALVAFLEGETVELRHAGANVDRYGRRLAHAYFMRGSSQKSAAHEMLSAGFARVSAHVGDLVCAGEMLAREEAARKAELGLWGEAYYSIVSGENLTELMSERGRFTVVEGRVASVRESAGTIYVNFGRRWSQALTVTILKRHERGFVSAGLDPRRLANLRVRVRGWIEDRNGPRVEATRPEQIEMLER